MSDTWKAIFLAYKYPHGRPSPHSFTPHFLQLCLPTLSLSLTHPKPKRRKKEKEEEEEEEEEARQKGGCLYRVLVSSFLFICLMLMFDLVVLHCACLVV